VIFYLIINTRCGHAWGNARALRPRTIQSRLNSNVTCMPLLTAWPIHRHGRSLVEAKTGFSTACLPIKCRPIWMKFGRNQPVVALNTLVSSISISPRLCMGGSTPNDKDFASTRETLSIAWSLLSCGVCLSVRPSVCHTPVYVSI